MENNENEIVLEFDLPGFKREDIDVKITDNSIKIKAERKVDTKVEIEGFMQEATHAQSFNYSSNLPNVKPEGSKIDFNEDSGKLRIKIPKD